MSLEDQQPSEALVDWADKIGVVQKAKDRPWWYSQPPVFATESFRPMCRCHNSVGMQQYPCEDNGGYVYIGQCRRCECIIWTVLECVGK